MAKIMLVEDDNNLREIYEARLAAEGYEIISAADGEAALALAIKEKPDLIISDIMMPKVSGFDMLDILRSTTETKNSKIIMMTALNQAEDKARAEKLGADVYLVKSQVTLEDVVRSAKNLLGEQTPLSVGGIPVEQPAQSQTSASPATSLTPGAQPVPQSIPITTTPASAPSDSAPQAPPAPVAEAPLTNEAPSVLQEEAQMQAQIEQFITNPSGTPPASIANPAPTAPTATNPSTTPTNPPPAVAPAPPQATIPVTQTAPSSMAQPPSSLGANTPQDSGSSEDKPAGEQIIVKSAPASSEPGIDASISGRKKVIKPISDVLTKGPDLDALLQKEGEAPVSTSPALNAVVTPEGSTLSSQTGTPTMTDVIAPNPQAAKEPPSAQPLPPPVA